MADPPVWTWLFLTLCCSFSYAFDHSAFQRFFNNDKLDKAPLSNTVNSRSHISGQQTHYSSSSHQSQSSNHHAPLLFPGQQHSNSHGSVDVEVFGPQQQTHDDPEKLNFNLGTFGQSSYGQQSSDYFGPSQQQSGYGHFSQQSQQSHSFQQFGQHSNHLGEIGQQSNGFGDFGQQSNGFDDFGQQSNGFDDFGQQSNGFDDFGQQSNGFDDFGQQSNGFDDFGQQSNGFDDFGQQSNGFDDFGQQSNGFDDFGQQSNGFDNFGQQSHGFGEFGQQSNGFDDFSQQSNGFHDFSQQGNGFDSFGQESNGFEDFGQQSNGFEDFGQQSNGFDNVGQQSNGFEDFSQQSNEFGDFGQQSNGLEGFHQESNGFQDFSQQSNGFEDFDQHAQGNIVDLNATHKIEKRQIIPHNRRSGGANAVGSERQQLADVVVNDCFGEPRMPVNAESMTATESGRYYVTCSKGHGVKKPNGRYTTTLAITCENGTYHARGYEQIPDCIRLCGRRPCENGGVCTVNGRRKQCQCSEGFGGRYCNVEVCQTPVQVPSASAIRCQTESTDHSSSCELECNHGYTFEDGEQKVNLICSDRKWTIEGHAIEELPKCRPRCTRGCENGGTCTKPESCTCTADYTGAQCETEIKRCLVDPKLPMNARAQKLHMNGIDRIDVTCKEHFEFPNGETEISTVCYDGEWKVLGSDAEIIPDCQAQCHPKCDNGATCQVALSGEHFCQCPVNWRGPTCRYPRNNCNEGSLRDLGYNGGYECREASNNNVHTFTCTLSCPEGTQFDFQPAASYQCDYATGSFTPEQIPTCNKIIVTPAPYIAPSSGVCVTWGGSHYKSFDDKIYSFESQCSYVFVRDMVNNAFQIDIRHHQTYSTVMIFVGGENRYMLSKQGDRAFVTYNEVETIPIPGRRNNVVVENVAGYLYVKAEDLGISVRWNTKTMVAVTLEKELWNQTAGLCGRMDGYPGNDWELEGGSISTSLPDFVNSWQLNVAGGECFSQITEEHTCGGGKGTSALERQAEQACQELYNRQAFKTCHETIDPTGYFHACRWDYCRCRHAEKQTCLCESMAQYFQDCQRNHVSMPSTWRAPDLCPMHCINGAEYSSCTPANQRTCHSPSEVSIPEFCVEGCTCPIGKMISNGSCVEKSQCPCQLHGKEYAAGDTYPDDCNTCTCVGGVWECTSEQCDAHCFAIGDPHYTTFDGKKFDFMGKCTYYLVKHQLFSIEAENTACAGKYSEGIEYPKSIETAFPSCTKSLTINMNQTTIHLKQRKQVAVNGKEVLELPVRHEGIYVTKASSEILMAYLPNGVSLMWDGKTNAEVVLPAKFFGEVKGLCGTFNNQQSDDFLTPEGDVEASAIEFARKWKVDETCDDRVEDNGHPCDAKPQNLRIAETNCLHLKDKHGIFRDCHAVEDPEPHYRACLYDICACVGSLGDCLCSVIASYARSCTRKGVHVEWRQSIRQCGINCANNQVYQVCGNSCTRTCKDISNNVDCNRECVEGCNCMEGYSLNSLGECVLISQCPCIYKGREYQPGDKHYVPGTRETEECTCMNGVWSCVPATSDNLPATVVTCDNPGWEVTACEPDHRITCKNMHEVGPTTPASCQPGCQCKEGHVIDSATNHCVKMADCPCHHGGRSYADGDTINQDCNLCTCQEGRWRCTTEVCAGTCTAWGASHYETFDGRVFDFHGDCSYMLAKGNDKIQAFEIVIQNVPCGSDGVTCSKAVTFSVGNGKGKIKSGQRESITLERGKPLPSTMSFRRLNIRESGSFVIVEDARIGVAMMWDKGTRVYITVDPSWRTKISGLCGNYDGSENNDFRTPSGGFQEANPLLFGDSWKMQNYCPHPIEIQNACNLHPGRRAWAVRQCSILKSELFSPCHAAEDPSPYVERCHFDACACDKGGDCECLCTAVAVYAQKCNQKGIPIKWRSPEFCPMQCDATCSNYEPCVSPCGIQVCDSIHMSDQESWICSHETCIEGCQPSLCNPGEVHASVANLTCVPANNCPCLTIGDEVFSEGQEMDVVVIREGICEKCYCSRHQRICRREACATVTQTTTTQPTEMNDQRVCQRLSEWINDEHPQRGKISQDKEVLLHDAQRQMGSTDSSRTCPPWKITKVECRISRESHYNAGILCAGSKTRDCITEHMQSVDYAKSIQQNVTCDSVRGLLCYSRDATHPCLDYEIRIHCNCGTVGSEGTVGTTGAYVDNGITTTTTTTITTTSTSTTSTTTTTTTTPTRTTKASLQCIPGWTDYMNTSAPDSSGETESIARLRQFYSFCPDNMISGVECQIIGSSSAAESAPDQSEGPSYSCTNEGAKCVNYGPRSPCPDIAIRFKCECTCLAPLGMQSRVIGDEAVHVSSTNFPMEGRHARLNGHSAWQPSTNNVPNEYIEVDLGEIMEVTGLEIQGNPYREEWVEMFKVSWSTDWLQWNTIQNTEARRDKMFQGNSDHLSVVRIMLHEPVFGQIIRITPMVYHNAISMRLELLGCALQPLSTTTQLPTSLECDPARPNTQHPTDCTLFYHCDDAQPEGQKQVLKQCGPGTYYHPEHMICAWPYEVVKVRPECQETPKSTTQSTTHTTTGWAPQTQNEVHRTIARSIVEECKQGWTEWYNTQNPDNGDGDYELLDGISSAHSHSFPCEPHYVTEASCAFHTFLGDVTYEESPDKDVTCTKEGLRCDNNKQLNKCEDYKVRFFCYCGLPTPKEIEIRPTEPEQTCHIEYEREKCGWTSWINMDKPYDSEGDAGDFEEVYKLSLLYPDCACHEPEAVECRDANTTELTTNPMICSIEGAYCWAFVGECADYEIRIKCPCSEEILQTTQKISTSTEKVTISTTTEQPIIEMCRDGGEWSECAIPCGQMCHYMKATMRNRGQCQQDTDCLPGCLLSECIEGMYYQQPGVCVERSQCNCMYEEQTNHPSIRPNEPRVDGCIQHTCEDNQRRDYDICTTTTEQTRVCYDFYRTCGYTKWFSNDSPDGGPDNIQLFGLLRDQACNCENPTAIECRPKGGRTERVTASKGRSKGRAKGWAKGGSKGGSRYRSAPVYTCFFVQNGFTCTNDAGYGGCTDYEFRLLCPCETRISTTPTPSLPLCNSRSLTPLLNRDHTPEAVLTASSSRTGFAAERAVLSHRPLHGWKAAHDSAGEYLQVDLGDVEGVYGVTIGTLGNVHDISGARVVRFTVDYSDDVVHFSPVTDRNNDVQVFDGAEWGRAVNRIFPRPVQARYIRIIATEWQRSLGMKIEVLGCEMSQPISPNTIAPPTCEDPMGLENGLIGTSQISASSVVVGLENKYGKDHVRLNDQSAWMPNVNDRAQFIEINFLELRNISGVVTKGHDGYWVSKYKLQYSRDGLNWEFIRNQEGQEQIFEGNHDSSGAHRNMLRRMVRAQLLRLIPWNWHISISLQLEILGCYQQLTTPPATTTPLPECVYCEGAPVNESTSCHCESGQLWDGNACVAESECPCYVNLKRYYVGDSFISDDCSECVCVGHGQTDCKLRQCSSCPDGEVRTYNRLCECACEPCPEGQRACSSPEICINETSWCDGIQDCKDDELPENCTPTTTTEAPLVTVECKISEKRLDTFSSIQYKLDVCHHVLAKHNTDDWSISLVRECPEETYCDKSIKITQSGHELVLHNDLTTVYDGHENTQQQANAIGSKTGDFTLEKMGNALVYHSIPYNYSIVWINTEEVSIQLSTDELHKMNGLCASLKPDGSSPEDVQELDESWALSDQVCEEPVCPPDIKQRGLQICEQRLREKPLDKCDRVLVDHMYLEKCAESFCDCVAVGEDDATCICNALTGLVQDCLSLNSTITLSNWRISQKCKSPQCEEGEIYQDCWSSVCEPSCENFQHSNGICKTPEYLSHQCISGCVCSPGLVRKGNKCISPELCRDCRCDISWGTQLFTFDREAFILNSTCTYVAARDIRNRDFEIYVTVNECDDDSNVACPSAVTVKFDQHILILQRAGNKVEVLLDGSDIEKFPHSSSSLTIHNLADKKVLALLNRLQVEVSYSFNDYIINIKVPSQTYYGDTEGLCANCNGETIDDQAIPREGPRKWLVDETIDGLRNPEKCIDITPPATPQCEDANPCDNLLDPSIFGQCHLHEPPEPWKEICMMKPCDQRTAGACYTMEAYAQRCLDLGICLDWRNETLCPANCQQGLQFDSCGDGCQDTCNSVTSEETHECDMSPTSGCYCPEGTLLNNGTCVEEKKCQQCDDIHYPGQKWKVTGCKTCECKDGGQTECMIKECAPLPKGIRAVDLPYDSDGCCRVLPPPPTTTPKPTCPPIPDTCEYTPEYSVDEITGLEIRLDQSEVLMQYKEIGERWMDGLCTECVCERSNMPTVHCTVYNCTQPNQNEMEHYDLQTIYQPEQCCPYYRRKACKYGKLYFAGESWKESDNPCQSYECIATTEGVERTLREQTCNNTICLQGFRHVSPKPGYCCGTCEPYSCVVDGKTRDIGDVWHSADKCTTFNCSLTNGEPLVTSQKTDCPRHAKLREDYVIEEIKIHGQCCPKLRPIQCKINTGQNIVTLQPGEQRKYSQEEPCKWATCKQTADGLVELETSLHVCNKKCAMGFEYVPNDKGECCGSCKPHFCVVNGQSHPLGDTWQSTDNCHTFNCTLVDGMPLIKSEYTECSADQDLLENYKIEEIALEGLCCPETRKVACKLNTGGMVQELSAGEKRIISESEPCKMLNCKQEADGSVSKQTVVEVCNEQCGKGLVYQPPEAGSNQCCGTCVSAGCVVNDQVYSAGNFWMAADNCTKLTCNKASTGSYSISAEDTCPPNLKDLCKPCFETFYTDEETIGMVNRSMRGGTVTCVNNEPITNRKLAKTCSGICERFTEPIQATRRAKGKGRSPSRSERILQEDQCCQIVEEQVSPITLQCDDGSSFPGSFPLPVECKCSACTEEALNTVEGQSETG